jgi:inosose dehydratase
VNGSMQDVECHVIAARLDREPERVAALEACSSRKEIDAMLHAILLISMIQPSAAGDESGRNGRPGSMVAAQLYIFGRDAQKVADPLDGVLKSVKRAGYDNVQAWLNYYGSEESAQRLAELLAKHNLAMPAAYSGGAMHVQGAADKSIKSILKQARLAAKHGLKIVVLNPQPLKREKTDEELAVQSKNLDRLGASLREIGVRLAIHQHAPEMRSGAREWYHILRNTSPEKVFFCLDLHWVFRGKQDPYKLLADAGKRVIDLHLRNSRNDVWSEDLGDGDVDHRRVKQVLDKIGYDGYYTVELAREAKTKVTRSTEENLRRSRQYVREVFGK